MRPPRSIIVLFIGMAALAIGSYFLNGTGAVGTAQIAPNVVASQSGQATTDVPATPAPAPAAPAATAQLQAQAHTPPSAAPSSSVITPPVLSPPIITPRRGRGSRDDD